MALLSQNPRLTLALVGLSLAVGCSSEPQTPASARLPALGDSPATVRRLCPDAQGLDDALLISPACGTLAIERWVGIPAAVTPRAFLYVYFDGGKAVEVSVGASYELLSGVRAEDAAVAKACPGLGPDPDRQTQCERDGVVYVVRLLRRDDQWSLIAKRFDQASQPRSKPRIPGLRIHLGDSVALLAAVCPGRTAGARWIASSECSAGVLGRPLFDGFVIPREATVSFAIKGERVSRWRIDGTWKTNARFNWARLVESLCDGTLTCRSRRYGQIGIEGEAGRRAFGIEFRQLDAGPPGQ